MVRPRGVEAEFMQGKTRQREREREGEGRSKIFCSWKRS